MLGDMARGRPVIRINKMIEVQLKPWVLAWGCAMYYKLQRERVQIYLLFLLIYYRNDAYIDGRIKLLSNLETVRILLLAASFEFFRLSFEKRLSLDNSCSK
jgi:hypothetical protein